MRDYFSKTDINYKILSKSMGCFNYNLSAKFLSMSINTVEITFIFLSFIRWKDVNPTRLEINNGNIFRRCDKDLSRDGRGKQQRNGDFQQADKDSATCRTWFIPVLGSQDWNQNFLNLQLNSILPILVFNFFKC